MNIYAAQNMRARILESIADAAHLLRNRPRAELLQESKQSFRSAYRALEGWNNPALHPEKYGQAQAHALEGAAKLYQASTHAGSDRVALNKAAIEVIASLKVAGGYMPDHYIGEQATRSTTDMVDHARLRLYVLAQ